MEITVSSSYSNKFHNRISNQISDVRKSYWHLIWSLNLCKRNWLHTFEFLEIHVYEFPSYKYVSQLVILSSNEIYLDIRNTNIRNWISSKGLILRTSADSILSRQNKRNNIMFIYIYINRIIGILTKLKNNHIHLRITQISRFWCIRRYGKYIDISHITC